jgi:hypothetical protein
MRPPRVHFLGRSGQGADSGLMHLNSFLRKITSLAALGNLVVVLAIFAAVAAASNSGTQPQSTSDHPAHPNNTAHHPTPTRGKPNPTRDKPNPTRDKPNDTSRDGKTGDRGNSETHRRDGTGTLPHPGKPKQGKTVNVDPGKVKGKVNIKLPGASDPVPLEQGASVPVGSVLDARHGEVTVNTAPREDGAKQFATFSGAAFQVLQSKTGPVTTEIRLRGGSFSSCGRSPGSSIFGRVFASGNRGSRKVRSLWGHGKGHFRTSGRNGAATVRGTFWLTQDRCDGTLVRVRRGLVGVRDFKKHKTIAVPAGHSYLARG